MLELVCEEGDNFLDFFSGSSTSAVATIKFNLKNLSKVSYIQIQLPEKVDITSEVYKAGYESISSIAKERIRRASAKIRSELEQKQDTQSLENLDLGFKVLKLDQSNFKQWQAPGRDIDDETLLQQMELNVDHIDPDATQEELLFEILIKAGVKPTEKIETIELVGHALYSVGEGTLLVHLQDEIDQPLIDAVLEQSPGQFICLDRAFHGNDQLKANAVKTFALFNQGKEQIDRVDFKTV